ncbi:MAG: aminodeoxychorismate synthase component I [Acidobacteria bacterium]|nr:aminodeoxychorismate synthase component I [Acidobacteriota bacterium]
MDARSLLFTEPERILSAHTLDEVPRIFAEIEAALNQGMYIAGFLAYEAGFAFEKTLHPLIGTNTSAGPLAWFGVYRSPETFQHTGPIAEPETHTSPATPQTITLDADESTYTERVERIRALIAAGHTYQANLTFNAQWQEHRTPAEIFRHIMRTQPVEYGALIHTGNAHILSASPELFLQREGYRIKTKPMKGTAPRGRWTQEDDMRAEWLRNDEKNRSENLMIVDLLRNDLGRICEPGSVHVPSLFDVERLPTVLQMTSTIEGTLRESCSYTDIFRALFPCGSIVGAPKIRTMQILHELESQPRGVYTGAIGYIAPDGHATFSVAIRTIVLRGANARMGVGSGIVYDSKPADEFEECRSKTAFLQKQVEEFELIETLLWDSAYTFFDEHLERLASSARYFDFFFDRARVKEALHSTTRTFACGTRHRVRLTLNRFGVPAITSSPLPHSEQQPISVMLAADHTNSKNTLLFHKTTARAQYDTAFHRAQNLRCQDALFINEHHQVTEGAIHNIVFVKDGRWLTPSLSCGLLPGVYRNHLLRIKPELTEKEITLEELLSADEIYLCNSVRGLRKAERLLQESAAGVRLIWESNRKI